MRRHLIGESLLTVLAVLVVLIIIFPFLWIVLSSFRNPNHFLSLDLRDALPKSIDISSYQLAFGRANITLWIRNSLLVAFSTTFLSLLVAAPMAFALTRILFRGRGFASSILILSYAVPSITLAVPLYVVLVKLRLNNTFIGLILVHATFTIPFATWVLRDFYHSIPGELEDAAYTDGAGIVATLVRIILPLSIPGLLAAGAYAFILSWNDFLFAFIIIDSSDYFTAPIGIHAYFTGQNMVQSVWAQLMAASVIVSLPSIILFAFFQRYLVSGFLSGSVKG